MKLLLVHWQRHWQTVSFDAETGRARIRWLSRKPPRRWGLATKHAGAWYALWSDGEHVIFQAGAHRYAMTDDRGSRNIRSGTKRTFQITEHDRVVFELTYDAVDRDEDPTFDRADLDQEDFFFFASRLWSDPEWRHEVVKNWGPSHG